MAPPSATEYILAMKEYFELKDQLNEIKKQERAIWIKWKKAEEKYNLIKSEVGVPATIDLTINKPF